MNNQPAHFDDPISQVHSLGERINERSIPLRLGLIGAGLLAFQTALSIWLQIESFWRPGILVLNSAAWILGITCWLAAMMTHVSRQTQWLVLVVLIGALWGSACIQWGNYSPITTAHMDNEMISEYAAEALWHGYNPYTWNFSDATRVYRDQGILVTTFLDGSKQNRIAYPALPMLLLAAFRVVGLGQVRLVSILFHTLLIILVFVCTPVRLRALLALSLFVIREFLFLTLGGNQDIVWCTLLVAMLLAWERPTLRAVLFGLACAFRQQPWFVIPFLLIYMWKEESSPVGRRQRIIYFLAVSFATFLVINLPFMLWNFQAWALSVFEHAYAAFNVTSHGLGALAQYNLLPLPRSFFSILQLSSFLLMLIVHWRHPRSVGLAFWIFPGLFFWLYYRGLLNYWLYWIPPLLIALTRLRWNRARKLESGPHWQQTVYIIVVVLIANLLLAAFMMTRPAAITADLLYPPDTYGDSSAYRLALNVTNHSERQFYPRFAVQYDGTQPLPWGIDEGPEVLAPGETGFYIIRTLTGSRMIPIARGAQLVLTDGGNDYTLRLVMDIPAEPTLANPDLIMNPAFTFWSPDDQAPAGWSWLPPEGENISPRIVSMDGQTGLVLSVYHGTTRLSQTITFPGRFSIQVYPTSGESDLSKSMYGLELYDGKHRLWILFGDSDRYGLIEENLGFVYQRAPLDEWSKQEIDPADLYARFGWELPPYSVRNRQGIEFAAPQVDLSLLVAGEKAAGVFGPIEQDPRFASSKSLVSEAVEHPDIYYVNLGDEYRRQRNYDLAEGAYRQAIAYNDRNAFAFKGLAWALVDKGQCAEAIHYFETAKSLDPDIQDPLEGDMQCP
jgi:hypothetical protein